MKKRFCIPVLALFGLGLAARPSPRAGCLARPVSDRVTRTVRRAERWHRRQAR